VEEIVRTVEYVTLLISSHPKKLIYTVLFLPFFNERPFAEYRGGWKNWWSTHQVIQEKIWNSL